MCGMNAVQKLRQMVGEIRSAKQPAQKHAAWELVWRLLSRMPVDAAEVQKICSAEDLLAFEALVTRIENPQPVTKPAQPEVNSPELKRDMEMALRAFRKRLKLSRLNDESKLGGRQMTSGRQSEIDAIIPPHEFPHHVWTALAKAGQLKDAGGGFFELPPGAAAL